MAEFTPRSSLIELGIGKVAEIAGGLTNLEVIRVCYMLVTCTAIKLHAIDLIFFQKMRFVNEGHLFSKFYLFCLEIIIRFAVASGCHTTGI